MKNLKKKSSSALAVLALAAGLGIAAPGPASAAYCGITWGSLPKTAAAQPTAPIINLRAGRHACFDRMVIDLRGERVGYDIRYARSVHAPGSGARVPLRGAADLAIRVKAPAYDARGNATYRPTNRSDVVSTAGYSTFRQIAYVGSFEGETTFGLGVRARLPYRVFTLDTPGTGSRLVVDVAHRW